MFSAPIFSSRPDGARWSGLGSKRHIRIGLRNRCEWRHCERRTVVLVDVHVLVRRDGFKQLA